MRLTSLLVASTIAAAPALAEDISYTIDGEAFTGYWAKADEPKGLVLIIHDWDGMTDYERQRADMLMINATPDQMEEVDTAFERLTGPDQMGVLFKVIAIVPPGFGVPPWSE